VLFYCPEHGVKLFTNIHRHVNKLATS
jgi:hypothetical protein